MMEFYYILYRALLCQLRNPMDVFFKVVQSVFTAVIVFLVFGNVSFNQLRSDQQKLMIKPWGNFKTFEESSFSSLHPMLSVACKALFPLFLANDLSSSENVSAKVTKQLPTLLLELLLTFLLSSFIRRWEWLWCIGRVILENKLVSK